MKDTLERISAITELVQEAAPEAAGHEGRKVRRKDLVNLLNYENFSDGAILVNYRHKRYGNRCSIPARPLPCEDDEVECRWLRRDGVDSLSAYEFDDFVVVDGRKLIVVKAELLRQDADGLRFRLPDLSVEQVYRAAKRHSGVEVGARVLQHSASFDGSLVDFSSSSFRVELALQGAQAFEWIDTNQPVMLLLEKGGRLVFSGECRLARQSQGQRLRALVLNPKCDNLSRFKPKEFRSLRLQLFPPPNVSFEHPLTGKMVYLQALDISSSGLLLEELSENAVLIPGLMVPRLTIELGGGTSINCVAQVLHRALVDGQHGEQSVKVGLVLLDMSIEDEATLSSVLHQAINTKARVCSRIDLEALWRFFFESGFIYPTKYASILGSKDVFRKTYESLYVKSPSIARHFVFQDKGTIYAHMSMLRYYNSSWMIHHHAASRNAPPMAGVMVLDHVGFYVNEFQPLVSTKMNYVMCYYRPENRFPNKVFGGVARDIKNQKGSSLDTFAYFHPARDRCGGEVPGGFELADTQVKDLVELENYYESVSGGLMLDALDLKADIYDSAAIDDEYRRHGFKRQRRLYSLRLDNELVAVFMVTVSDMGLNLSNLTNCVHVFVLDSDRLAQETLGAVLRGLEGNFGDEEVPVLVFPFSYMENKPIGFEKRYTLWVLSMRHTDGYFRSLKATFKRSQYERGDG